MDTPQIEYFYSAHSAYAYLGAPTLARIAQETGAQVIHRPFDFLPVVDAAGSPGFKQRSPQHIAYFFGRELRRWAQWRELDILTYRPIHHDNPLGLASGMVLAARDPDRLSFLLLEAHWRDDADIANTDTLKTIAMNCDEDADKLLEAAKSETVQAKFAVNTAEAIARGIFGSPTYFVHGDMFYGQDRLEMVERAITRPFDP